MAQIDYDSDMGDVRKHLWSEAVTNTVGKIESIADRETVIKEWTRLLKKWNERSYQ